MTRGSAAAATNAFLREELRAAADARKNLERRLHDSETDRARLREWKRHAEQAGLPGLLAERERADAAAMAATQAVIAERGSWVALIESVRPVFVRLLRHHPVDQGLLTEEQLACLAAMFGEDVGRHLPGSTRTMRRNTRTGEAAHKSLIAGRIAKERGLA